MRRKLILVLSLLIVGIAGYVVFKRYFLPQIIVNTLIRSDSTTTILPKSVQAKIRKAKKKVLPLTDSLIYIAHRQNITIDDILREIDKLEEEKVNSFHDELKIRKIKSADELFDFAKSSFNPEFEVEPFRSIFKANFNNKHYNEFLKKATEYRENPLYDFETSKLIAKQLILDREEKFNSTIRQIEKTK